MAATLPPPTALQHHQEICILNAGVNQPREAAWIGDLVRDAVSTRPSRNAYLHTSCMNDYTAHTPQSDAKPHAHIQLWWHVSAYTHIQSLIALFHRKTLTCKTDIFFPLKHSIGYLIFISKWPSLPTGVLACSNQDQPYKDKQPHVIYFYQQGMILLTVGGDLSLYRLYVFFVLEPHWHIKHVEKHNHVAVIKWFSCKIIT